jgi:hypothetical protein
VQQELLIGAVLISADGYGDAVKAVTLSLGSWNPLRRRSSQVIHSLTLAQQFDPAKAMDMKLHRLRDVKSDCGLLKRHG